MEMPNSYQRGSNSDKRGQGVKGSWGQGVKPSRGQSRGGFSGFDSDKGEGVKNIPKIGLDVICVLSQMQTKIWTVKRSEYKHFCTFYLSMPLNPYFPLNHIKTK